MVKFERVKAGSYRVIFGMLMMSVVFVLGLQAYWIWNFYIQKREALDRDVYQALEIVSRKLNEREGIREIQEKVFVRDNSVVANEENVVVRRVANNGIILESSTQTGRGSLDSVKKFIERLSNPVLIKTLPSLQVNKENNVVVSLSTDEDSGKVTEHTKALIDKMLLEIKVMDTTRTNADTLKAIINRALAAKGLFMPFEFALLKNGGNNFTVRSNGFDTTAKSYTHDLSQDRVLPRKSLLMLQPGGTAGWVLASMKGTLVLSLIFSLFILAVFYYTLILLLKQKKINEMKNDFINNMTHELKTPIATIAIASEALNHPQVKHNEEKFREYTRILKEENQKLGSHVERVLQQAQMDRGELELNKKPTDLKLMLERCVDAFRLRAEHQSATLRLFAEPTVIIVCDETHLQAVINNLLDNALKYCNKENCWVEISLISRAKNTEIRVKDNGIGIDKDKQGKVFDKFYRVQTGNVHDVKGFGLGLSYAHSVMQAHDGGIELISEKGKGSEFILRFKEHE